MPHTHCKITRRFRRDTKVVQGCGLGHRHFERCAIGSSGVAWLVCLSFYHACPPQPFPWLHAQAIFFPALKPAGLGSYGALSPPMSYFLPSVLFTLWPGHRLCTHFFCVVFLHCSSNWWPTKLPSGPSRPSKLTSLSFYCFYLWQCFQKRSLSSPSWLQSILTQYLCHC